MCYEILGFDIYIDKKAKPWLIEVNLAPSFANETRLDDELKRELVKDSFRLLAVSHREKIRKMNRKREEMQNRIVTRTSYKENMQKKKEELERLRKKRDNYEKKNMGNYYRLFPAYDEVKQELYMEYLRASQNKQAGMLIDNKQASGIRGNLFYIKHFRQTQKTKRTDDSSPRSKVYQR